MRVFPIWFSFLLILATGCPSGPGIEPPAPEPTPAPIGVDPTIPAAPGEVRGGVLPDDDVAFAAAAWGGIAAEARPGDLVLYNDRARFVVRRELGHGYVGVPGALIDADVVRPDGQLGRDTLEEAFLAFGIGRLAGGDSVELIADGSDGEAVVRVTSRDRTWDFVQGVAESDEPLQPEMFLETVTDYVLVPDTPALRIVSTITNVGTEDARVNPLDGLAAAAEDLLPYGSGEGMDPGDLDDPAAMGVVGRQGEAAMLLYRADGPLARFGASDLLASSGIELLAHGFRDIPPGESVVLERFRAVGPDPATVEAARMQAQGIDTVALSGSVSLPDGGPVAGARVHLVEETDDGPRFQGFALTGADGSWSMRVPPGEYLALPTGTGPDEFVPLRPGAGRYGPFTHPDINARQLDALRGNTTPTALPSATGHAEVAPTPVSVTEDTTLNLELPPSGSFTLSVQDANGPLPSYVEVERDGGAPSSPINDDWRRALGLPNRQARVLQMWVGTEPVTVPLPPGTYSVSASGSPRHERAVETGVTASETGGDSITIMLERALTPDGWLAMDSHLHAAPSTDGDLPMEERIVACAAAGVELPVTTDHDRMVPYGPLVPALGLDDFLTVIDGVEVSPVLRGHFNLFPATGAGPSARNGGAPAWWEPFIDTDQLFERIKEGGDESSMLQINHGREGSGMMSAGGYQPDTGEPFRPDSWSWNFELIEIVNSRGAYNWVEPRDDWYSFLSVGQKKVPVGVSDAHGRTSPCGYGRTDVYLPGVAPGDVTPAALSEAVMSGHVIVNGGLSLRVAGAGGELPGDTVTGDSLELTIEVLGPSWAVADTVRVVRNGETVFEEAITGPADGATWWSGTFTDTPSADSWYVVETEGSQSLGGLYGGAIPYGLSNAMFLDVAGDGWDAPGLPKD